MAWSRAASHLLDVRTVGPGDLQRGGAPVDDLDEADLGSIRRPRGLAGEVTRGGGENAALGLRCQVEHIQPRLDRDDVPVRLADERQALPVRRERRVEIVDEVLRERAHVRAVGTHRIELLVVRELIRRVRDCAGVAGPPQLEEVRPRWLVRDLMLATSVGMDDDQLVRVRDSRGLWERAGLGRCDEGDPMSVRRPPRSDQVAGNGCPGDHTESATAGADEREPCGSRTVRGAERNEGETGGIRRPARRSCNRTAGEPTDPFPARMD